MSHDNRVRLIGEDTYQSQDGKFRYQSVDGQWHRFDLSYSATPPIDGPGNGFASLAEVVRFHTGQEPVIV